VLVTGYRLASEVFTISGFGLGSGRRTRQLQGVDRGCAWHAPWHSTLFALYDAQSCAAVLRILKAGSRQSSAGFHDCQHPALSGIHNILYSNLQTCP
jgi:hypothetical protein